MSEAKVFCDFSYVAAQPNKEGACARSLDAIFLFYKLLRDRSCSALGCRVPSIGICSFREPFAHDRHRTSGGAET
jgi:hypothetical protein